MSRPSVSPGVVDTLSAAVPPRAKKRLEAEPNLADTWRWESKGEAWTVTTDGGEAVRVRVADGVIRSAEAWTCTCPLGPRCLHVLAVARVLPLSTAEEPAPFRQTEPSPPTVAPQPAAPGIAESDGNQAESHTQNAPATVAPSVIDAVPALAPGAQRALRSLERDLEDLLGVGLQGASPTLLARLRRAVHGIRLEGLARLHGAAQGVLRASTRLSAGKAFDEPLLPVALECLWVADGLARWGARADLMGEARRAYSPSAQLRVGGLCTEPIIGGTGKGALNGVRTHLIGYDGRLYSTTDLRPRPPAAVSGVETAAVPLTGATLSHRELSRGGLFLRDPSVSSDGRLSSSKSSSAVRAEGTHWWEEPVRARFEVSPAQQLVELGDASGTDGLLFVRFVVLGVSEGSCRVQLQGGSEALLLPPESHSAVARANLGLLARARGMGFWGIGRKVVAAYPAIRLLALSRGPGVEAQARAWPADWRGVCNIAFDALQASWLGVESLTPVELEPNEAAEDPMAAARSRLVTALLAGRSALPASAISGVEAEMRELRAAGLGTMAEAMGGLLAARSGAGEPLRLSMLRLLLVEAAISESLGRAAWEAPWDNPQWLPAGQEVGG
jgi:hypothetical protein